MKNRIRRMFTGFALLMFCLCSSASFLAAQSGEIKLSKTAESRAKEKETILNPSLAHVSTAFKRVFTTKSNLIFLGAGTAATLIARPFDDDISRELKEDDFGEFEVELPNTLGSFFVVAGASLFTHIIGRAIKKATLANTGLYMFEAVMTTQLLTFIVKESVGRTRPDGSNNLSFPSGHTSAITTAAAVIQKRHGWKVGIPAYLLSTYVGVTRIKTQKHFASDVLAGATIGTIIGLNFVSSSEDNKTFGIMPLIGRGYAGIHAEVRF